MSYKFSPFYLSLFYFFFGGWGFYVDMLWMVLQRLPMYDLSLFEKDSFVEDEY